MNLRQIYIGIFLCKILCSCVANHVLEDADIAEKSVNRLSRITLRMSQAEVLQIMHAPYDTEMFRVGEDRYDVWFYVTTVTVLGQSRMVPRNLTPLTFRNRELVGVGYDYYHWLQRPYPTSRIETPAEKEERDRNLERELNKAITPVSGPSNSPDKSIRPSRDATHPPTPRKSTPAISPQESPPPSSPRKGTPAPQEESPAEHPTNLKLGPPSQKREGSTQQQSSMSRTPETKPANPPEEKSPKSDKPEWDEEDEKMQEESMDQDFNYW